MATRVAVLETQVGRIVSDIESEKATRARSNSQILLEIQDLRTDQRKADKILYMGIGGLAALQLVLSVVFSHHG